MGHKPTESTSVRSLLLYKPHNRTDKLILNIKESSTLKNFENMSRISIIHVQKGISLWVYFLNVFLNVKKGFHKTQEINHNLYPIGVIEL